MIADALRSPLVRHDRMIAGNSLRSALSRRGDRLFVGAMAVIALVALHHLLAGRPLPIAIGLVGIASALVGMGLADLVHRRLAFHASDGVLAADALHRDTRRDFGLVLHLAGSALVLRVALIGRPDAALVAPAAYLAGAALGHGVRAVLPRPGARAKDLVPRALQAFLRRPVSGALAAGMLILILPALGAFDVARGAAFAGILGAGAALMLTTVDDAAVRFMTLSGYPAGRIIGRQARPLLLCLALTLPAAVLLSRGMAGLAIAGAGAAALALMAARVLAYRVHDRRIADLVLGLCVVACALAGLTFPPAVPLVVLAILWGLARRSAPATWRLA